MADFSAHRMMQSKDTCKFNLHEPSMIYAVKEQEIWAEKGKKVSPANMPALDIPVLDLGR